MQTRILLKTTIGPVADDWNIGRFSLLAEHLRGLTDPAGASLYHVVARDRIEHSQGHDTDLEEAARGAYGQLWLIAVDATGALTQVDVGNIGRFRQGGGGILLTRDHQDLGACLPKLGAVGATHFFQTVNPDPDASRRCRDATGTPSINWADFQSRRTGESAPINAA